MPLKDTIKTALNGLKTNKSRTLLTLLGIVIGITAIILVMSVGKGAENMILNQVKSMGSQTISVEPGRMPKGPSDFAEMFTESLKKRELDALKKKNNVRNALGFAPFVMAPGTISYQGETYRGNLLGIDPFIQEMMDMKPEYGRFITDDDVKQKASVAIIGSEVKKELFGQSDAIGQKIKIKNKNFRIIGVGAEKGQVAMLDLDSAVLTPYTTVQQYILGIDHYHAIMVKAKTEEMIPRVVEDIKLTLRELHNITDPDKDDFHVASQADAVEMVGVITGVLTILLSSVAAISLVVGGIGIMNIMLVSVAERTREIGLRKALGATSSNILTQFLAETVIMTIVGGITGVCFGSIFAFIASIVLNKFVKFDWLFVFPVDAAILGIIVAAGTGLIFGIYPARKASQKSPIEALRYE